MGAWDFIRPHLAEAAGGRPVHVIARPRSASPGGRVGGASRAPAAAARRRRVRDVEDAGGRAKPGTEPAPEQVAG